MANVARLLELSFRNQNRVFRELVAGKSVTRPTSADKPAQNFDDGLNIGLGAPGTIDQHNDILRRQLLVLFLRENARPIENYMDEDKE